MRDGWGFDWEWGLGWVGLNGLEDPDMRLVIGFIRCATRSCFIWLCLRVIVMIIHVVNG